MSRNAGLAVMAFAVATAWRITFQMADAYGGTGLVVGLAIGIVGLAWASSNFDRLTKPETPQERKVRDSEWEIFYRVLFNRFGPWLVYAYLLWKFTTSPWPLD